MEKVFLVLLIGSTLAVPMFPLMIVPVAVYAALMVLGNNKKLEEMERRQRNHIGIIAEIEAGMVKAEELSAINAKLTELERSVNNLRNSKGLK